MNNSKQLKHLYARGGFGLRFEDAKELGNVQIKIQIKKKPYHLPYDTVSL
jgi:hypothetical protein